MTDRRLTRQLLAKPLQRCLLFWLALVLSGCAFDSAPATPTRIPATPTPIPTPTPLTQHRVPFLPETTRQIPAPNSGINPALRSVGQLLYIGTLRGQTGIIGVNADGRDRRLVAEGNYNSVLWSPDGQRFAAGEARDNGPSQVDLYSFSGRELRRFTIAGYLRELTWSPDSSRVAVVTVEARYGTNDRPRSATNYATWLLDEAGAVEIALGEQTYPGPWSSRGRLALSVRRDSDADNWQEIWTVDTRGGDARKLAIENALPVGWSNDGTTLYVAGSPQPFRDPSGQRISAPTNLLALDIRSGAQRSVVDAAGLGALLAPDAGTSTQDAAPRFIRAWLVSPTGNRIALWVTQQPTDLIRQAGREVWHLIVVDDSGRILWQDDATTIAYPTFSAWSPGGLRFAYAYERPDEGSGRAAAGVRVVNVETAGVSTLLTVQGTSNIELRWSPDGRWLALARSRRLDIVPIATPAEGWVLASDGRSPSWRPNPRLNGEPRLEV